MAKFLMLAERELVPEFFDEASRVAGVGDLVERRGILMPVFLGDDDRTLDRVHHALYVCCRELGGGEVSPTAAIIDSQSVKSAEKGGARSIRAAMTPARGSRARSATSW